MGGKKYTPLEFLKYIRDPLAQSEIDRWIKVNGITIEMSSLLFDFISSLYSLVNETYLGEDYVTTNEDRDKHFDWCWSKVINNFEKESIYFNDYGEHYEYFRVFFEDTFYNNPKPNVIHRVRLFFTELFEPPIGKRTKSELDVYSEMYKIIENNLKY